MSNVTKSMARKKKRKERKKKEIQTYARESLLCEEYLGYFNTVKEKFFVLQPSIYQNRKGIEEFYDFVEQKVISLRV